MQWFFLWTFPGTSSSHGLLHRSCWVGVEDREATVTFLPGHRERLYASFFGLIVLVDPAKVIKGCFNIGNHFACRTLHRRCGMLGYIFVCVRKRTCVWKCFIMQGSFTLKAFQFADELNSYWRFFQGKCSLSLCT